MRCFRLVKARHARAAFTGSGARAFGGRWNRPGTPLVYAAQSLSLAALETVVHFSGEERGIDFVCFAIDVPDACVEVIEPRTLAHAWRSEVPAASTQDLGSRWQESRRGAALAVPSALVTGEFCVLLNPDHRDTRRVVVHYPERFSFDDRLLRS